MPKCEPWDNKREKVGGIMGELILRFGTQWTDGKVFRRETFNNYYCRHDCLTAQKAEELSKTFDCCRKMYQDFMFIDLHFCLKVCQDDDDMFKAKHG